MLLAVTFSEFIKRPNVIIGILLAILGLASIFVAGRVSQAINKTDKVIRSSKSYIICSISGLVGVLVGMILIALP